MNELGGSDVLVPGNLYHYQLDAAQAGRSLMSTSRAVVDALRPFDNTLDPQRLAEEASSTPGALSLITLNKDDNDRLAPGIGQLPGVVITRRPICCPPTPASPRRSSTR